MKIFEAMVFKREIGSSCSLDVKMIETLNDGLVLTIDQDLVDDSNLASITDFVDKHKLNLLLDSQCYFISTGALKPSRVSVWEN